MNLLAMNPLPSSYSFHYFGCFGRATLQCIYTSKANKKVVDADKMKRLSYFKIHIRNKFFAFTVMNWFFYIVIFHDFWINPSTTQNLPAVILHFVRVYYTATLKATKQSLVRDKTIFGQRQNNIWSKSRYFTIFSWWHCISYDKTVILWRINCIFDRKTSIYLDINISLYNWIHWIKSPITKSHLCSIICSEIYLWDTVTDVEFIYISHSNKLQTFNCLDIYYITPI